MSVHSLVQDLHITDFTWLALGDHRRVPPQEATKRRQLVEHLMYWLFEQFLIPLLRVSCCTVDRADLAGIILRNGDCHNSIRDGLLFS